jgi:RNA-directed DNA polymerase
MGLERRDRVRRSDGQNNWKQEDADTYDRQAVQYYKEASVRDLQSGQIQCGLVRCGWADDRAVRFRLAEQSLQALEPDELGKLLPPPVRAVSVPKKTGGQRILGVPTFFPFSRFADEIPCYRPKIPSLLKFFP